jgi:hypothetical protein
LREQLRLASFGLLVIGQFPKGVERLRFQLEELVMDLTNADLMLKK